MKNTASTVNDSTTTSLSLFKCLLSWTSTEVGLGSNSLLQSDEGLLLLN